MNVGILMFFLVLGLLLFIRFKIKTTEKKVENIQKGPSIEYYENILSSQKDPEECHTEYGKDIEDEKPGKM